MTNIRGAYLSGRGPVAPPMKYKLAKMVVIEAVPVVVDDGVGVWKNAVELPVRRAIVGQVSPELVPVVQDQPALNLERVCDNTRLFSVGYRADHSFLYDAEGKKKKRKRTEHCTQTLHRS